MFFNRRRNKRIKLEEPIKQISFKVLPYVLILKIFCYLKLKLFELSRNHGYNEPTIRYYSLGNFFENFDTGNFLTYKKENENKKLLWGFFKFDYTRKVYFLWENINIKKISEIRVNVSEKKIQKQLNLDVYDYKMFKFQETVLFDYKQFIALMENTRKLKLNFIYRFFAVNEIDNKVIEIVQKQFGAFMQISQRYKDIICKFNK